MPFQGMWPAAALSTAVAIIGLWYAWRHRSHVWLALALGGAGGALWLWARSFGIEFGALFAMGTMAFGAWTCIVLTAPPAHIGRHRRKPFRPAKSPKVAALLRGTAMTLLAGPAALAASLVACLHLVYWLPGDPASRWVTAAFLLPLSWALVATISLAIPACRRVATFIALLTVLGMALLPRGSLA